MTLRILIVSLVLLAPSFCGAGEYHIAGSLPCADCHLQHGVDPENPDFIGPYSFMLRKNSVNELCLSCHDGTNSSAPDVLSPVAMYDASPSHESAAGSLAMIGVENHNGHTLGLPMATPLQTAGSTVELNCISCHAPHGNQNYRNLLKDPAGTGASIDILLGSQAFEQRNPDNPPTSSGSAIAYSRDNVAYATGISAWCSSCHDQLSTYGAAPAPAHFNAHPSDIAINGFGLSTHTDDTHWTSGIGEGFSANGRTDGIARVPFQTPNATDFTAAHTAQPSNAVSCLSCHKAHGSENKKAMLWPYLEGGDTFLSGCQQCHNK